MVGGEGDGSLHPVVCIADRLPLVRLLVVVGGAHLLVCSGGEGNDYVGGAVQLVLAVRQAEVNAEAALHALLHVGCEH